MRAVLIVDAAASIYRTFVRVLATLLPTAFFAALDRGVSAATAEAAEAVSAVVNDTTRGQILRMSRGMAVMLLVVYVSTSYS